MDKNELGRRSLLITETAVKGCLDLLGEYLSGVGGTVDVNFEFVSSGNDAYTEDYVPFIVRISKVFLCEDEGCDDVCVMTADDEPWVISEYLTIDEMLSLIDYLYMN